MLESADLFKYCLHLGDNALILAQSNSGWCGHGPVLEQDIAITNITLDLLGQARNFYQHAASLYNNSDNEIKQGLEKLTPRLWRMFDRELNEDDLAFLREERQFLNLLLCELPKGDWAFTVLRQFFFSTYQQIMFEHLLKQPEEQLCPIIEKSLKEIAYHVRWSSEWVIRLGDGTEQSNRRINFALHELWPFVHEVFSPATYEQAIVFNAEELKRKWSKKVEEVFAEATLSLPPDAATQSGGKIGRHTEYMGYILPEMQHIQRAFPNQKW